MPDRNHFRPEDSSHQNKPREIDWNDMAAVFDRWLPYIQPVAEALLDLADISEGQRVLDVAVGTGEPALTLAHRYRNQAIEIIGVDGAAEMLTRAREKAETEHLSGLSFQEMQAEDLNFDNNSFDRVICRFGLMLFDQPLRSLEEMRRVLKKRGKLALSVWGAFDKLPTMALIWDVLMQAIPPEDRPELPRISRLGDPETLRTLLKKAGFDQIKIIRFKVSYQFEDFESYWSVNTSGGLLKAPLELFTSSKQLNLKKEVESLSTPYQKKVRLIFENEAILVLAEKE